MKTLKDRLINEEKRSFDSFIEEIAKVRTDKDELTSLINDFISSCKNSLPIAGFEDVTEIIKASIEN